MKKIAIFSVLLLSVISLTYTLHTIRDKNLSSKQPTLTSLSEELEVSSTKLSKEEVLAQLAPKFRQSFKDIIKNISDNPDAFIGFPATCFAPDSDPVFVENFYRSRSIIENSFGFEQNTNRFNLGNRWGQTAINGPGLNQGDLTTLTWSYVPDGTAIGNGGCGVPGESNANSNFIAFFNSIYGSPTVPGDFTTAPWHQVFISMFDSWSQASGLIFVYEPNDDGATVVSGGQGVVGVRGDMRISGRPLDGNSGVLACNYFPEIGDMIIDTSDNFYTNNPGIGTTNVLTHEIGHGLGIFHVCPVNETKLMEPFVTIAFQGPQEDDILATNRGYGDPDGDNDSAASAVFLGNNANPSSYSRLQRSIDDSSEIDYFSFSISEASVIAVTLTPTGSTYLDGVQLANGNCTAGSFFDALSVSDLMVEVLNTNGSSVIATGNANGAGQSENLVSVPLPIAGTYFVRVRQQGTAVNNVQMYDLNLSLEAGVVLDNDVAITNIVSPGAIETGLTSTEQIEITLTNFGSNTQSNIPYELSVDNVVIANEIYAPSLAGGTSVTFNIPTTVDLSAIQTYNICVKTLLVGDENSLNDETCKTVQHVLQYCTPTTLNGCNIDGIKQFVLGSINADDGAEGCNTDPGAPQGYADRTNLVTDLDRRAGFNTHTLQASTRYITERIKVWIDFNNNGDFTDPGEEVLNQLFTITNGTLENFSITIPTTTSLGNRRLRARAFDADLNPINTSPCEDIFWGETQDYTVNIIDPTATCAGNIISWDGTNWLGGIAPDTNDVAIINGNYNTAIDGILDVCELIVNSSAILTIDPNTYVRVENDILVDGNLIIEHTASLVQIEDTAVVANNGTIEVKLETPELKPRDIIFLGSPMTAETNADAFGSANRVMEHLTENFIPHPDVTIQFPLAENFADDNFNDYVHYTGTLQPGEGYLIRPRPIDATGNEVYQVTFDEGTLNNGVITYTVKTNTDRASSYNMLANPYPSAISALDFMNANPTADTVYFWEHVLSPNASFPGANDVNFSMQDVSMFNSLGAGIAAANEPTSVPSGIIGTGQGFAIKAIDADYTDATDEFTATFTNDMRVTSNENIRAVASDYEVNRLWLEVKNETYQLQSSTLIGFTNRATQGFDLGFDSNRMATAVSLYSHLTTAQGEEKELGIQSREAFDENQELLLGFSTMVDELQTYTISVKNFEGAALQDVSIYLVDLLEGITTNLSETNYNFTASKATFNERFLLRFTDRNVLNTSNFDLETISVYPNPTSGLLTVMSLQSDIIGITVTDIQGRVIASETVAGSSQRQVSLESYNAAVYFVTITTEKGSVVKRVIKK